jgi:hypothetical protein
MEFEPHPNATVMWKTQLRNATSLNATDAAVIGRSQELTFTPASYGLGDPYIYLRTSDYIASFNLSTGQFIAEVNLTTAKYPNSMNGWKFTHINHLWVSTRLPRLGCCSRKRQRETLR